MNKEYSNAKLQGSSFEGQDLQGAKFANADIRGTNFSYANLTNVDFTGSRSGLRVFPALAKFIFCLLIAFLSGNFSSLFVNDFIVSWSENGTPAPATTGGLIVLLTVIFIIYRFGSEYAIKTTIVSFALGILVLLAAIVVKIHNPYESKFIEIVAVGLLVGAIVIVTSFIYATTLYVAFSISIYVAVLCVISSISVLFFGANKLLPFSGIVQLLIAFIAWRAILGDERQKLILNSALKFTKLWGTSFKGANLTNANFDKAIINTADFTGATLIRTNLRVADKKYFLSCFRGTILNDYSIRDLLMNGFNNHKSFKGKNLKGAFLDGFDLSSIDLTEAEISEGSLKGSILINANLTKTHAIGTCFNSADLTGACIEAWNIDYTTQLKDVICKHIYLLNGQRERRPVNGEFVEGQFSQLSDQVFYTINSAFGLKEQKDLKSFFNEALQFHSCFISYSSKDEDFTKKLFHDLKNNNVQCWFAPEDLKIGEKIRTKIDESIHRHDKLLIILSENSLHSTWVEHEIETALDKEIQQGHTVLFPIKIDDSIMEMNIGWAAKIRRERNIGDFRDWFNHQKYDEALKRLLHDLKTLE